MIALMLWVSFLWPAQQQPTSPQPTPWETWARSVEERFTKSQREHKALVEAIEKLKETPDVVKDKANEIKDQQTEIKTVVDEVKAKQEEAPPINWLQSIMNAVVSVSVALGTIVAILRKIEAKFDFIHAPNGDKAKDAKSIPSP